MPEEVLLRLSHAALVDGVLAMKLQITTTQWNDIYKPKAANIFFLHQFIP
jgi:hypothetical protein